MNTNLGDSLSTYGQIRNPESFLWGPVDKVLDAYSALAESWEDDLWEWEDEVFTVTQMIFVELFDVLELML